jgi:thiol-disulfide isomerase/thioredoxin
MKRIVLAIAIFLAVCHLAYADPINLKPYQQGDWSSIIKSANRDPIAIHFWGVTCPACVKEMPQWGTFVEKNKNLKIIFIQVDDVSPEMIKTMLSKAKLDGANHYYVSSPFDERLRYEIDPKWRGETPITILVNRKGQANRKTGPMNFSQLSSWFNKND